MPSCGHRGLAEQRFGPDSWTIWTGDWSSGLGNLRCALLAYNAPLSTRNFFAIGQQTQSNATHRPARNAE